MTRIAFYEKPGCGGNARQCQALLAAGHTLERRNLLTEAWTRDRLLAIFGPLPVADWFNRAAPRVKSGALDLQTLDAASGMALLLAEPLLIRRPLMQRLDDLSHHVGFETAAVHAWVGLNPETQATEHCAHTAHAPLAAPSNPTCGAPHASV